MKLSDQQFMFAQDLVRLGYWLITHDYKYTLGEAWRPDEMQEIYYEKGLSKVKERGAHGNRLAQDLNIWVEGKLSYKKEDLQPVGDYWESLDERNTWGGNWKSFVDTPHFERRKE